MACLFCNARMHLVTHTLTVTVILLCRAFTNDALAEQEEIHGECVVSAGDHLSYVFFSLWNRSRSKEILARGKNESVAPLVNCVYPLERVRCSPIWKNRHCAM